MKNFFKTQMMTVVLITLCMNAFAQQTATSEAGKEKKRNLWFGLRAGTDFATPTTDYNEIKDQLSSNMQVGVYLKMGKKLFFQPEIYGNFATEQNADSKKIVANSIRVPILLGVEVLNLGVINAHLMAGPMGTLSLNERLDQKYDYKLQLGGGIEVLRLISLDVRYGVNMDGNLGQELKHLSLNSGVNVTLGIQFR